MLTKEKKIEKIESTYLTCIHVCIYIIIMYHSVCIHHCVCVYLHSVCPAPVSCQTDSHTRTPEADPHSDENSHHYSTHTRSPLKHTHTHTMHHGFHQISVRSLEEVDRSSGLGEWLRKWAGKWRRHIKAFPHRSSPRHCRPHSPRCDHTSTSDPHTVH